MALAIMLKTASNDLTAHTRSEIICKDEWRRTGDGNKQRRRCGMLKERNGNEGYRAFGEWEDARETDLETATSREDGEAC